MNAEHWQQVKELFHAALERIRHVERISLITHARETRSCEAKFNR